jgi:hypothetical protein
LIIALIILLSGFSSVWLKRKEDHLSGLYEIHSLVEDGKEVETNCQTFLNDALFLVDLSETRNYIIIAIRKTSSIVPCPSFRESKSSNLLLILFLTPTVRSFLVKGFWLNKLHFQ